MQPGLASSVIFIRSSVGRILGLLISPLFSFHLCFFGIVALCGVCGEEAGGELACVFACAVLYSN